MARGGARPGAGRPRKGAVPKEQRTVAPDIKAAARVNQMTPLEYMLAVMNDEDAEAARRDRMAQAAAPFVHAKPQPKPEKEDEQTAVARKAQMTGWDNLLPN